MRVKGEDNGKQFFAASGLLQCFDDRFMAGMKSIEIADSHSAGPGEFFQAAAEFHCLA
jgi:hypothetical protein